MYQRWMEERVEQARAPVEGDAVVATPAKAVGTGAATGKTGPEGQKGGVVAASLTRDWNWSTF